MSSDLDENVPKEQVIEATSTAASGVATFDTALDPLIATDCSTTSIPFIPPTFITAMEAITTSQVREYGMPPAPYRLSGYGLPRERNVRPRPQPTILSVAALPAEKPSERGEKRKAGEGEEEPAQKEREVEEGDTRIEEEGKKIEEVGRENVATERDSEEDGDFEWEDEYVVDVEKGKET